MEARNASPVVRAKPFLSAGNNQMGHSTQRTHLIREVSLAPEHLYACSVKNDSLPPRNVLHVISGGKPPAAGYCPFTGCP